MYFFNLKRKVKKTTQMLRLWYMRPILLKRSPHLSRTILSLNWEKQSITFHVMMMIGKVPSSGNILIFSHPGRSVPKNVVSLSFSIFFFTFIFVHDPSRNQASYFLLILRHVAFFLLSQQDPFTRKYKAKWKDDLSM